MVRSPSDVLRVVVAATCLLAVVVVELVFGSSITGFAADLLRGIDALHEDLLTAIIVLVRVGTVALLLAGLVVSLASGRWRLIGRAVLAGAAGAGAFALLQQLIDAEPEALVSLSDSIGPLTDAGFPTGPGLAATAAVTAAVTPWLPRRLRRIAWILVFGLALTLFLASPVSSDPVIAVLTGWTAGAAVVLALGAPSRRASTDAVVAGLQSVGVGVATLEPAAVDARGSTPYFGATTDGRGLFVKVLGRDERSADMLFRIYRALVPADRGDERPFSSLRRTVEHEALLALAARDLGVLTPRVVGFADVAPESYVLSYEAVEGRSLDRYDEAEITDEVLRKVWAQLAMLRRHRIAHRDLRLANLFLDVQGDVWMIDFGFSELSASELLLATDLAELLASLSLKVGPQRAVAAGAAELGADALATAVPRLRLKLLSGATRTGMKERPGALDELTDALRALPPAPPPLVAPAG